MKYFKVEITQSDTYIVDIKAKNETEAKKKAKKEWNKICEHGMYHYHQTGDTNTEITCVYDVTNEDH